MDSKHVMVAMSGGVDSMISAAILKKAGWQVEGIYLILHRQRPDVAKNIASLKDSCHRLDIPLHIINMEEKFQSLVIDYFLSEYSHGFTPNPCTTCNQKIKFGLLLDNVLEMGAGYLATGHYARIKHADGQYHLIRGLDPGKDQSYFLYRLGQRELKHLIFPIGDLHKCEVLEMAASWGLNTSNLRESQDACFIVNNNYRLHLIERHTGCCGDIIDTKGNVLGKHRGIAMYTVGQRQGLGLSHGKRLHVLELDAEANKLIVGTKDQLMQSCLTAYNLSWISGTPPSVTTNITAKIRYGPEEAAAILELHDSFAEVYFSTPQMAISPGQDVVFYHGREILGGGIIGKQRDRD